MEALPANKFHFFLLSTKNDLQRDFFGNCSSEIIHWRSSQSCWYFPPSFLNCCPSNLLSGTTLSPLPPSCVKVHYLQTVCGWEGVGGCCVQLETIFCRSLTLCICRTYNIAIDDPEQKPLEGRRPETDTQLPQNPTGPFFR
jgi:hypothetical protein